MRAQYKKINIHTETQTTNNARTLSNTKTKMHVQARRTADSQRTRARDKKERDTHTCWEEGPTRTTHTLANEIE